MSIPTNFNFSIATLIVISILCFVIAGFLIIRYIRQDQRTHDTLFFISAMVIFGLKYVFQCLWYVLPDPAVNQLVNTFVTMFIIIAAFLLTTFFFSIYFKESKKKFQIILVVTAIIASIICVLLVLNVFPQTLLQGTGVASEYRFDYGDEVIIISFLYLIPVTFINFGLFLLISIRKYEGRLRLKSVLMAVGLLTWVIAEILGPYSIFYILSIISLFIILIGFVLKKE
ncbi:MAG: hypothetical protein ACTSX4_00425 [Candidatus Helarchaeota archaeon]